MRTVLAVSRPLPIVLFCDLHKAQVHVHGHTRYNPDTGKTEYVSAYESQRQASLFTPEQIQRQLRPQRPLLVVLKRDQPTGEQLPLTLPPRPKQAEQKPSTSPPLSAGAKALHEVSTFIGRLKLGEVTAEELQSQFTRTLAARAEMKQELMHRTIKQLAPHGPPSGMKKEALVDTILEQTLRHFALGRSITWVLTRGGYEDALRKLVDATTDKDIYEAVHPAGKVPRTMGGAIPSYVTEWVRQYRAVQGRGGPITAAFHRLELEREIDAKGFDRVAVFGPDTPEATALTIDEKLRLSEDYSRSQLIEHCDVLDREGRIILHKTGAGNQIEFSEDEMVLMRDHPGVHFTHNHPSSTSLSAPDILIARQCGMAEMRAIGKERYRYSITFPPGWNTALTREQLVEEIETEDRVVRQHFQRQISVGELSIADANLTHWHTIWIAVAKRFGWTYSREEI